MMNWADAVAAMRQGKRVQRKSEQFRELVSTGDGVPVYQCGQEPCMLAAAWTAEEAPTWVFRGADSGVLFVPDDEHRAATDWVTV